MARQTLVLDASVGVKWFSATDETALEQSLNIRNAHVNRQVLVAVPDLFYYEVVNAIVHKRDIPDVAVRLAVAALFALELRTVPVTTGLLAVSSDLSRRFKVTIYDSCYAAIATAFNCPLVTANPRHQGRILGCEVIPIEAWK